MRDLIPLVVGLVVAALAFIVMQLFVWELLHGGPELRDHWIWFGGLTFLIVPLAIGFLVGWVVYWWMGIDWSGSSKTD